MDILPKGLFKIMLIDEQTYHRSLVSSSWAAVYHSADTDLHTHLVLGTEWVGSLLLHTDHTHNSQQRTVGEVVHGKQQKVQNCSGGYHNGPCCCIKLSERQCRQHSSDLHIASHNQAHRLLMFASCWQKPHQSSQLHLGGFESHPQGDY